MDGHTKITVTLDDTTLTAIDNARAVGQTRSGWIAEAARQRLARNPNPEPSPRPPRPLRPVNPAGPSGIIGQGGRTR